ncbi:MAG TPA: thioesterase family protein [Acidimicrobiia bacterium]
MTPAAITIQRRVQWMDTDAAGIWHHSVVLRWTEEAEAELHRGLGIIDLTFGATPRVKTEFEFPSSVRFDDVMDITLTVSHVGTTSMTYEVEVSNESQPVANGRMVVVFIDRATGEKKPWPETVREALTG